MGLSIVPLTLNAVSSVRNHEQGLASSLLSTSQQIGGSLGLAVLVTVAATVRNHQLATSTHVTSSMLAKTQLAATVQGFQAALRVGALSALIAFLIALLVVRTPQSVAQPASVTGAVAVSEAPWGGTHSISTAASLSWVRRPGHPSSRRGEATPVRDRDVNEETTTPR
jgi:hypothetical protein